MNKKISVVLASLLVYGCSVSFSQRPLPYVQEKKEFAADDVVGTWKWFCGSVVSVTDNGEVRAVWDDGKHADGRFDKIGDNKYRFIWGNNESIEILKIKKEGNLLEGQNQAGSKVTAIKISSTPGIVGNQKGTSDQFLLNAMKTMQTTQDFKKFIGEWKMSSWNGHYRLLGDGSCIIDNDPSHPSKGIWFLAFDRLYLVWGMMSDTDVFKLNPDQSMKLQRIDNRSPANVTFEKLQAKNSPSNKETTPKPIIRRRIRVPQNPGEPVKEVEPTERVVEFNGHSYKFITKKMPWKNAKKMAEDLGGYLVCITSQEEQEVISNLITINSKVQPTWIGLTDEEKEGEFRWVNGEKLNYTNWSSGNPNNGDDKGAKQNYVWLGFFDSSTWDDNWEYALNYSVVEFDKPITQTSFTNPQQNP
jgi:hypothetical protein